MGKIEINGREFEGFRIDLDNAPLLVIKGEKGFLACGYIDIDSCNGLGDVCGIVKGVNDFDEMLGVEVVDMSEKAKEIIDQESMNGGEFLLRIHKT